jgi:hypothetical protein
VRSRSLRAWTLEEDRRRRRLFATQRLPSATTSIMRRHSLGTRIAPPMPGPVVRRLLNDRDGSGAVICPDCRKPIALKSRWLVGPAYSYQGNKWACRRAADHAACSSPSASSRRHRRGYDRRGEISRRTWHCRPRRGRVAPSLFNLEHGKSASFVRRALARRSQHGPASHEQADGRRRVLASPTDW